MKLRLSPYGVKSVQDDLQNLKNQIFEANEIIVDTLVTKGTDKAIAYNNFTAQSGTTKSQVVGYHPEGSDITVKGVISLEGEQAVYEEFGTGDEGLRNSHPLKGLAVPKLNPYNSGPTIRVDKNGKHYWVYPPMAGYPYFDDYGLTHGIPAGKAMYNTTNYIRDIKDGVIKKTLNSATKFARKK